MSLSMYQNAVTRLTKDKADLEGQANRERGKIVRLKSEINSIARSITRTTGPSLRRQKEGQIERKEKDLLGAHDKLARMESKIADKAGELARNAQSLRRAVEQENKKQDSEDKKRRDAELAHRKRMNIAFSRPTRPYSRLPGAHLPLVTQSPIFNQDYPQSARSETTPPQPRETGDWDALFDWYYAVGKPKRMSIRVLAGMINYSWSRVQHKKKDYDDVHGTGRKRQHKKA
jgi:hypothetical protein